MRQFIYAVRTSVAARNWYGALTSAFILPDICAKLQDPKLSSSKRYPAWCDTFLTPYYTVLGRVFLTGRDAYALRCAFLHEGADVIVEQQAQESLERFHFIAPRPPLVIHNNRINAKLQLQVDRFCEDMCLAATDWERTVKNNAEVQARMRELALIHEPVGSF